MPITINGSGTVTGISAGGLPDDCITTADIAAGAVTQAKRSEQLTSETAKTATGTSVDFTGIPSWVKRITVMFNGVSTNGANSVQIQLGTGGTPTYTVTGYLGACGTNANGVTSQNVTQNDTGFLIANGSTTAAVQHGTIQITNVTGNTWSLSSILGQSNTTRINWSGGSIPLAAALTAVRITTVGGTDSFDAGTINILYE